MMVIFNIEMTFSHDYYLYEVLFRSYTNLPLKPYILYSFYVATILCLAYRDWKT